MARKFLRLKETVQAFVAAADPFYRGPGALTPAESRELVRPLNPVKTWRDLGYLEPDTWMRIAQLGVALPVPPDGVEESSPVAPARRAEADRALSPSRPVLQHGP